MGKILDLLTLISNGKKKEIRHVKSDRQFRKIADCLHCEKRSGIIKTADLLTRKNRSRKERDDNTERRRQQKKIAG